ncbi:EAL domain-containing protein [Pseudomonas cannabina]|uniref:GAF domain/GGDEF domain/EAL domain-containing protein n=1 Tax=Pseudomonas cannabina TaxID=86840 RepID=A0A0P9KQW9_PSECA|nr:EAL domain-containing protein [Pseudomonas cannabina]KAA8706205.1 EAL domain-containing protein [Pseudomonas cannabina]KPW65429.1 GAF domain/GGDEF domain/EAL domain-containing protein [Pseudomonas cannabina]RMN21547.1 GAF domain/GGDEF domain/EAL domain-containing protein [Pseudomonas cannabina]SDR46563.1 diguanylate cyclase/phosphodiesterase /diguanylate cyclase/phosphodiesterase with GAF sensor [Pseudomonas cannabina]
MNASAPIPMNETQRLLRIRELCVLEDTSDDVLDEIVSMTAAFFQSPIALVSIVDENRQWFRARVGLKARETPRNVSFCAYTILSDLLFEVPNATLDERFVNNGLVTGHPDIRYYAGAPLITDDGLALGSLCVIDTQPREPMTAHQTKMLMGFASLVMKRIVSLRLSCFIDQPTGLYNRSRLEEDIHQALASGIDYQLVAVDMISSTFLNDIVKALGYSFSQDMVTEIKNRLESLLPSGCPLYKVSPTRFGFLLPHDHVPEHLFRTILQNFETPVECRGIPVQMQVGLGVVSLNREPNNNDQDWMRMVISAADDARDRELGWAMYEPHYDAAQQRAFKLLSSLTTAVHAHDQLRLVYQPRIDLNTGLCTSVEALLRWNHPTLGPIGPAEFVPLAEKTALMRPLSLWVLKSAIEQAASWQQEGFDFRIAINVSPEDLTGPAFTDRMIRLLGQHKIDPTRFELEFTEGALMHNPAEVRHQLERMRQMGMDVAIDDFGTGYSNWNYLRQLPATTVKLDQSLIRNLASDKTDQRLVKALIGLAKKLGYCVVAEGIETDEIRRLVKQWGCDEGQGYLIAKPMEADALVDWLGPTRRLQSVAEAAEAAVIRDKRL